MRSKPIFVGAAAALVAASCSGGGGGRSSTHAVHFDVGGFVAYLGEPAVGLAGVEVTLRDAFGDSYTAVTGSSGLWTISSAEPGIFTERYELAGYESVTSAFALEAFGQNDVSNPFVARPTVLLEELRLRASVTPFGIELTDGEEVFDGAGGNTLKYSLGNSEYLVVDLNMQATEGFVVLADMMTGDFVIAALDSSTSTSFTVSGSQIDAMNSGAGLTPTPGPLDLHQVGITVSGYTPIHGDPLELDATAWFSTTP